MERIPLVFNNVLFQCFNKALIILKIDEDAAVVLESLNKSEIGTVFFFKRSPSVDIHINIREVIFVLSHHSISNFGKNLLFVSAFV